MITVSPNLVRLSDCEDPSAWTSVGGGSPPKAGPPKQGNSSVGLRVDNKDRGLMFKAAVGFESNQDLIFMWVKAPAGAVVRVRLSSNSTDPSGNWVEWGIPHDGEWQRVVIDPRTMWDEKHKFGFSKTGIEWIGVMFEVPNVPKGGANCFIDSLDIGRGITVSGGSGNFADIEAADDYGIVEGGNVHGDLIFDSFQLTSNESILFNNDTVVRGINNSVHCLSGATWEGLGWTSVLLGQGSIDDSTFIGLIGDPVSGASFQSQGTVSDSLFDVCGDVEIANPINVTIQDSQLQPKIFESVQAYRKGQAEWVDGTVPMGDPIPAVAFHPFISGDLNIGDEIYFGLPEKFISVLVDGNMNAVAEWQYYNGTAYVPLATGQLTDSFIGPVPADWQMVSVNGSVPLYYIRGVIDIIYAQYPEPPLEFSYAI